MKKGNHLPVYGVGPLYVVIIIILTVLGMMLSSFEMLESGDCSSLKAAFSIVAVLLIIFSVLLWFSAVKKSEISDNILKNHLITNGIYAWVRNPIYSAFLFICTGILLFSHNLWLLILPFFYWTYLTILMKYTEEKWLLKQYGAEYTEYCRRTNRCIPWFPRKK